MMLQGEHLDSIENEQPLQRHQFGMQSTMNLTH